MKEIIVEEKSDITRIVWDGLKYHIFLGEEVDKVVPFPMAGKLMYNGSEMFEVFEINKGESLEYFPLINHGDFTWEIKVCENGSRAVVKVRREQPGRFVLNEEIQWKRKWFLERNVSWEDMHWSVQSEAEQLFKDELAKKGIKFGVKPDCWKTMIAVQGTEEIVIAEQTEPIEPVQPQLEDFVSKETGEVDDKEKVDYFATRIIICEKDEILAKKIIGKDGTPGIDVFGKELPVSKMKDFQLNAVKNVYLSDDGLELRASSSGAPLKLKNNSYAVENVYTVNEDVSLGTGSIEFPGDVLISKNVMDGLHVYSSGRVNVKGLVSGAKLKAEGGMNIGSNVFNSDIIVGERHYHRSLMVRKIKEMEARLQQFITQLEEIRNSVNTTNFPYKNLFRAVLEKKYRDLPLKAEELSRLIHKEDEDFVTREILIALHTIKYFVVGTGPSEIKNNHYLITALREINHFLLGKGILVPERVVFVAGYVQNSDIKCSGDFMCRRDVFNSNIKVDGSIKIYGVCRGSKLASGVKVSVHELGSAKGGGETSIHMSPAGKITVEYCHANVKIHIGNKYVMIDQPARKLDAYIENGKLYVDKLKWDDSVEGI